MTHEWLPRSQSERAQPLGHSPQSLVSEVEQYSITQSQFFLRRAPAALGVAGTVGRDPDEEMQSVCRESQPQFGRRSPLPQSAFYNMVAAQKALAPPAAAPRQPEHAALGQSVLDQMDGVTMKAGRRGAAFFQERQGAFGRFAAQEIPQQPQQVCFKARNTEHGFIRRPITAT